MFLVVYFDQQMGAWGTGWNHLFGHFKVQFQTFPDEIQKTYILPRSGLGVNQHLGVATKNSNVF